MRVATGETLTPIGRLRLAATEKGLVRIAFPSGAGSSFSGWLKHHVPDAEPVSGLPALDQALDELERYFEGKLEQFEVELDLRGTPFQLDVWRKLREIPFGATWSYAELARAVKRPLAHRAAGSANGANPVPVVVPCHRVVRTSGKLGGYGGGLDRKRALLAFERGQRALV